MSDFVEFPEEVYARAGDVFAKFDGKLSTFTLENALAMMWFAQLTYEVDDSGQNASAAKIDKIAIQQWKFQTITPFRQRAVAQGKIFDTTGLVGQRNDAIVLAFAGTDPGVWETVATDGGFLLGAKDTHEGFQAAFEGAAPPGANGKLAGPVGEAIEKSRSTGLPLFVTGHSLGAALSLLAADAAVAQGVPPRAFYGYGTPCPGGATFRDRYNAALGNVTYRLVHGRDVVARVPMFKGYFHVGRLLQTKQDTKFDAGKLTAAVSKDPLFFAPDYLKEIGTFLLGGGFIGVLKGLVMSPPTSPQELAQAVIAKLPPRGNGPLGKWFRLLPPFIREHLEDRYIEALTQGPTTIRQDLDAARS
jgi:triacylglycerol lipase